MKLAAGDRRIVIALLLCSAAYYLAYFNYDLNPSDEGYLVYGVERVLEGQTPGADFHAYEPGRYWLLAPFFAAFGSDVVVERAVLLVHRIAIVLLVFVVARRFLSAGLALIPTLAVLILPGPWHKSWFSLFLLAALALAEGYLRVPRWRTLLLGGVLSGVGLVFRLDIGAFCGLMWGVALVGARRSWSGLARRGGLWLVAAAGPVVLAAGWLAMQGKLWAALRFFIGEYLAASGQLERLHPKIAGFPSLLTALRRFPVDLFELLIWASLASAVVLALVMVQRWRGVGELPWPLLLLGAGWGCAVVAVLAQPDRSHLLQNGAVLAVVGVVALVEAERLWRRERRPWLAPAVAVIALGALVAENLFAPGVISYYTGSIRMRFGPQVAAELPHSSVRLAPWVAEEYRGMLDFIAQRTGPDDGLATCFCLPMLNLMSERGNPTGLDILFPHTIGRSDQQRRYLAGLGRVRLFVANNCELDHQRPAHCSPSDQTLADFAPAVVEVIGQQWRPVYRSVHGFATIYARVDDYGAGSAMGLLR